MKLHATLVLIALTVSALAQNTASPNEQARFLAGMTLPGTTLAPYTAGNGWQGHAKVLHDSWLKMERRQLINARAWARTKMPDAAGSSAPVFYFFSGPDFIYPQTFFPNARTYILCGIEPVGTVPEIERIPPETLGGELSGLRQSLHTMLQTHYFITADMRAQLARAHLGGTLPVLYVFLARTGCTIRGVKTTGNSAEIAFTGPGGHKQTLYYFKTDLSNGGSNDSFLKFCRQFAPAHSLVKSASYLMHGDSFSTARNFLLQNSRLILQDDSGIPLKAFDPARWDLQLYGSYFQMKDIFASHHQPDLAAAYARGSTGDLGFAFGYHWQKERALLMLARPK